MKAGLIVAAGMAAVAQAEVVRLDQRIYKDGADTPETGTFSDYLDRLNEIFDGVEAANGGWEPLAVTTDATGRVYKKQILESGEVFRVPFFNVPLPSPKSFVFVSRFESINENQKRFLESLYSKESPQFSPALDPTFIPGAAETVIPASPGEPDLSEKLGVASSLQRTKFEFFDGLELLDRKLEFVSGRKPGRSAGCEVLGNPSVTRDWVVHDLGMEDAAKRLEDLDHPRRWAASNLYPSGDRLCIQRTGEGTWTASLAHMVTSNVGGLIGSSVAVFGDGAQGDAYLTEANVLECEMKNLATNAMEGPPVDCKGTFFPRTLKSAKVVEGSGDVEAQAVSSELGAPASGSGSTSSCSASWAVLLGVAVTSVALTLVAVFATEKYRRRRAPKTPAAEPSLEEASAPEKAIEGVQAV